MKSEFILKVVRFYPLNPHLSVLIFTVLLKFRTDKGRDPDPQTFTEDSKLLIQIRDDVFGALAVSTDLLCEDFTRYDPSSRLVLLILPWRYWIKILSPAALKVRVHSHKHPPTHGAKQPFLNRKWEKSKMVNMFSRS